MQQKLLISDEDADVSRTQGVYHVIFESSLDKV